MLPESRRARVRDADATRARLLRAATDEFAAHGIAGARVDRIGAAANANKALIYTYFGSKDQLFDAVMDVTVVDVMERVPFTPLDLPGYAGRLFDFLSAHPYQLRLATWHRLEREGSGHEPVGMRASLHQKAADIAAAQARGGVAPDFSAEDLLAFTMALEEHRTAVVEAVRRLVSPAGAA